MAKVTIIIPCFNEATRLNVEGFVRFVDRVDDVHLLFVDDGSDDDTADVLRGLAARSDQLSWMGLPENRGKGEAVRAGVNEALGRPDAGFVGYFDADLATPLTEIHRLAEVLDRNEDLQVVLGSRVQLMGRRIERRAARHYSGRVFATFASLTLDAPTYDTQCGAKIFRGDALTRSVFRDPFLSRWLFDIELLARVAKEQVAPRRFSTVCTSFHSTSGRTSRDLG